MKQPDTASICSNLDSSYSKKIFKSNPSKHNLCEKRIKRSVIRLNYEKIAQNLLDAINDLGSELDVNMHVCVLLSNGTKEFGVVVEISSRAFVAVRFADGRELTVLKLSCKPSARHILLERFKL